SLEVVVYAREYALAGDLLKQDEPLLVQGRVNVRDEEISVRAEKVRSLSEYRAGQARRLRIALDTPLPDEPMRRLVGALAKSPGPCQVELAVLTACGHRVILDCGLGVVPTDELLEELEMLLPTQALSFAYAQEGVTRDDGSAGRGGRPRPAPAPTQDAPPALGQGYRYVGEEDAVGMG
ncbi:MAG: hypothetical protein HY342_00480, partial [Candidatus Lambdaproteobacteria bacterium]|nr:hypothetical protein [Candidatus Lambdaproteobacteria bacterium]